jgi:hypothetical protein
VVWK